MKKFILLLAALGLINTNAFTQGCLPEGITFTTQAQVDNFQTNYPGCTEIEGDVTITGSNIRNLNGLNAVASIVGNLNIWNNQKLTKLTGLHKLISIGGSLHIRSNSALTSLTGLESLTFIEGNFRIYDNNSLTDLTGLNNLSSIGDYLHIELNHSITNLTGLENLIFIGGYLRIENNMALVSLNGLESMTSIGGNIEIIYNSSLSTCNAQWLCDYLAAPSGVVNIYKNTTGCNSIIDVAYACGGIPCLPYGNYYFQSQADIDNFQAAFPNCTELQGNVIIRGNDITDLSGLDMVTSIGGILHIGSNSALTSLLGLRNLSNIDGSLQIG